MPGGARGPGGDVTHADGTPARLAHAGACSSVAPGGRSRFRGGAGPSGGPEPLRSTTLTLPGRR
ncbi:hypothetical protein SAM23877_1456 [Streptomyces ambofaciens ATCC 23877]|uniref:Uncharacterized protein n=1 Tax=Streptomyces ambofaciens (strain ATCC 23877 / 3486 / DSM 40053 / JCM 4204 / NBRC 12836 / NRRL B-2516) TaxID=278992 RepID=A0A0K2AN54_STRA7|nr:hypothetical protein SAM23877_1456 [Streptomyces ambofaciens ATCC 23877]